jgi:hypothetical protein
LTETEEGSKILSRRRRRKVQVKTQRGREEEEGDEMERNSAKKKGRKLDEEYRRK